MKSKYAIIVAGGKGSRLNKSTPKQYIKIDGKPLIIHTLNIFLDIDSINIIVVVPENDEKKTLNLCSKNNIDTKKITVVNGGKKRFHSVKNALITLDNKIKNDEQNHFIAIHDAARMLVRKKSILQSFNIAYKQGSAVASNSLTSTIRQMTDNQSIAVDRSKYKVINTPQTFRYDWLKKAYNQPYQDIFTDDASVVEYAGFPITLYEDYSNNIKVTYPEDIIIAEALLKNKKK